MASGPGQLRIIALAWLGAVSVSLNAHGQTQNDADRRRGNHVDILVRETFTGLQDDELTQSVEKVGRRVIEAAGNPHGYEFRFRVLNDPTPNAMAAAAGYIYVTTGLLQLLQSKDELAVVVGHEVAHINERHPAELFPDSTKIKLTTIGLQVATQVGVASISSALGRAFSGSVASAQAYRAGALGGAFASLAFTAVGQRVMESLYAGYAKEKEFRADSLAIEYAGRAGYEPDALVAVLQRLVEHVRAESVQASISQLHSTGPRLRERLDRVVEAR